MGFSYVPGKPLFIFFMSFLDPSPDSLASCFPFSLNRVFTFQKKIEFQKMKEAKIACVCAAESVSTSIIRRFKLMEKDIVELKPAESTLSDIDTIQVEIHRCPKCIIQYNFFQTIYSSVHSLEYSFLVYIDGRSSQSPFLFLCPSGDLATRSPTDRVLKRFLI